VQFNLWYIRTPALARNCVSRSARSLHELVKIHTILLSTKIRFGQRGLLFSTFATFYLKKVKYILCLCNVKYIFIYLLHVFISYFFYNLHLYQSLMLTYNVIFRKLNKSMLFNRQWGNTAPPLSSSALQSPPMTACNDNMQIIHFSRLTYLRLRKGNRYDRKYASNKHMYRFWTRDGVRCRNNQMTLNKSVEQALLKNQFQRNYFVSLFMGIYLYYFVALFVFKLNSPIRCS